MSEKNERNNHSRPGIHARALRLAQMGGHTLDDSTLGMYPGGQETVMLRVDGHVVHPKLAI